MSRQPVNSTPLASQKSQFVQAGMSLDELQREWRRLYKSEPPKISRDLLVLGIAYRRQEIEHGGLGKATLRKLQTLAKTLRTTGRVGPSPSLSFEAGRAPHPRMAWPNAHRHRDRGRIRVRTARAIRP